MKKILSVVLAVMMLFGCISVSASAAGSSKWPDVYHQQGIVNDNQAVLIFNLNGGTMRDPVHVYNPDSPSNFDQVTGYSEQFYYMLPMSDQAHLVGSSIVLPVVVAPSGSMFSGWEYTDANGRTQLVGAGGSFYVDEWIFTGNHYGSVTFTAKFIAGEAEEDTLKVVMGVLTKIFGAIIGIVLYGGDTEQGVALMNKVLGGLF